LTLQAYFDIEIDGKDAGRLDFELFGHDAPQTVNNFLGLCSGDFDPLLRYKGSYILAAYQQRFLIGGDITNGDGTGSCSVNMKSIRDHENSTFDAERNKLKFNEPYLLAMAANKDGKVGSQFMITLTDMPVLDRKDIGYDLRQLPEPIFDKDGRKVYQRGDGPVTHTIFGRLIQGTDTIHLMEGQAEFKRNKIDVSKRLAKSEFGLG
jgi:peptidylprolyl isomerase